MPSMPSADQTKATLTKVKKGGGSQLVVLGLCLAATIPVAGTFLYHNYKNDPEKIQKVETYIETPEKALAQADAYTNNSTQNAFQDRASEKKANPGVFSNEPSPKPSAQKANAT